MEYQWNIQYEYNNNILELIRKSKNMTKKEFDQFLDIKSSKFRNPNLLPNIEKAVERTKQAIKNKEKIMIAGDYDCDGVTSTSIMVLGLSTLTPYVSWTIPLRSDGYGLSNKIVDKAIEDNIDLIITVDNGISAKSVIEYANQNNIDVIVTDHHQLLQELPTDICVDPCITEDYPFQSICGCMVAYKFLRMLIPDLHKQKIHDEIAVLTAFGTIGDMMLLIDENRKFVSKALSILNKKEHISYGIDALVNHTKLKKGNITSSDIAFYISPSINALGRLEDASVGVQLFLSDDEVLANTLAEKTVHLNNKRKTIQQEVVNDIKINEEEPFIIKVLDNIPAGLLGVVAGKFVTKYQKPCFLLHSNKNNTLSGSGRSYLDYDISKCISENFDICNGGGHKASCGLSLNKDNFNEFKKRCYANYNNWLKTSSDGNKTTPTLQFLCELDSNAINDHTMSYIKQLEPFGTGNSVPQFCMKDVRVVDYRVLGENKNTIKFAFYKDGNSFEGICFNETKEKYEVLHEPNIVDIGFELQYNYWNGNKTIQLLIKDIRNSI